MSAPAPVVSSSRPPALTNGGIWIHHPRTDVESIGGPPRAPPRPPGPLPRATAPPPRPADAPTMADMQALGLPHIPEGATEEQMKEAMEKHIDQQIEEINR